MSANKKDLRVYLQDNLLIGDGAMATQLYRTGVPVGVSFEELCLSNPQLVHDVHKAYYDAGARLLETNTFGANRDALSRYGLEHKVTRINRAAVAIAREAAKADAFVIGSIGSILAGRVRQKAMDEFRDQFEEQAIALIHAGVDGLILETFLDVEELLLAIDVIRPLTDQPLICQLATLEVGRTRDGYTLTEAFSLLQKAGADIVGLNCRLGPAEILRSYERVQVPEGTLLSAFPNAGRLGLTDGEYAYKSSPEYFAESAKRLREQGVRLLGGCCGTTPEHVKAMADALHGLAPQVRVNPSETENERPSLSSYNVRDRQKPSIVERVKTGTTIIVEFDPPKDLDTEGFLQGCCELHKAGADSITLADNSLANVRMSNMALGAIMKSQYGMDPLIHIACRDRNLIGQQSHLMGLHALGIDQVLVVTGDPSRFGDLPGASSVFDVTSFDLIRMVKQLNEGISFSGRPLKQKAQFIVGAAFNPNVRQIDAAIKRLEKKVEAGADFIMTQPVYDAEAIRLVYESTKHINIPVFIGIMPLTSQRNAEFLHNEVPGIKLSDEALARMRKVQGEEARQEGIKMAKELLDAAIPIFNGIYLITPFNYYAMSVELIQYVRQKSSLLQASAQA
ncbi:bifunctional homocysteine S-methyltransferase/methylenetetrahydrofolate reductase [Brevibacillus borstelensis]|uniref:bifunctional homocysteine S-methyltransferase/methylenetetrahydrofolate reductase n=1 Tax=Brevibacillus borstelensis TaxID=45462 RepID=UPI000F09A147|nr:bifunctional homocysteine S-methyltransferase/methylenetetrahydrofolate reductase [Brevibacillus borstelensis]MED1873870.1 bifunctional homocysteine S-methyltransferase/methylenetetrahydrofolate reductase [Brevibacillus borstelensis]MED1882995.1 bifunctional homocysteine S-methyltransferase/methylenetetrahydrofolate reductase [Brevibacillus borstelensis]RNB65908.1 bifunctional homocysteine S-methyltransferase/methylenetetrahydrofolate reductase [Brevibacillus borstelensis]GED53144.1 bifuncti